MNAAVTQFQAMRIEIWMVSANSDGWDTVMDIRILIHIYLIYAYSGRARIRLLSIFINHTIYYKLHLYRIRWNLLSPGAMDVSTECG
jgi:hypothetical protein